VRFAVITATRSRLKQTNRGYFVTAQTSLTSHAPRSNHFSLSPEKPMKTLAAIVHEPQGPFVVEEVDLPELEADQILVRVVAVGVCHTDLASREGLLGAPFPAIFGHEGAGIVERTGSRVKKVVPGDHVVLAPASDGTCPQCQSGAPMYCDQFNALNFQAASSGPTATVADGTKVRIGYFGQSSFSRHAIVTERNTVKVRRDVPLHLLGPLGCGIQTGAGTVINGMCPHAGASIAIIGTGAVGLAAVLGAVVSGCATIIAIDRVPTRLALAMSLGATHSINTSESADLASSLRAIAPLGVNYLVDSAGVPALVSAALGGLARLGMLGLVAVPPTVDRLLELPWSSILLQGQIVQGFIEGNSIPDIFIPQLVDLYREGRFPFDRLIERYPFADIARAVEDQRAGRTIKAVLEFGEV
jgi:aryl-alcohol dehydrogenase